MAFHHARRNQIIVGMNLIVAEPHEPVSFDGPAKPPFIASRLAKLKGGQKWTAVLCVGPFPASNKEVRAKPSAGSNKRGHGQNCLFPRKETDNSRGPCVFFACMEKFACANHSTMDYRLLALFDRTSRCPPCKKSETHNE